MSKYSKCRITLRGGDENCNGEFVDVMYPFSVVLVFVALVSIVDQGWCVVLRCFGVEIAVL